MSSVQAIDRAFAVLDALGSGPLGVTEVAVRTGLPKSTAARLLTTLVRLAAVEQVPGGTDYRLGTRLLALTAASLAGILVLLLTAWPWLDKSPGDATGVWMPRSRRTQNLVFLALVVVVIVFTLVGTFLRGPYWHFYWPWEAWPEIPGRI